MIAQLFGDTALRVGEGGADIGVVECEADWKGETRLLDFSPCIKAFAYEQRMAVGLLQKIIACVIFRVRRRDIA